MEKIFCEEPIKPDLSDDTLAHYGVKGMRWRHKKRKNTKKTGDKIRIPNSLRTIADQAAQARTNEEKAALLTAIYNQVLGYAKTGERVKNVGGSPTDERGYRLSTSDVDSGSKNARQYLDYVGTPLRRRNKKKTRSSK